VLARQALDAAGVAYATAEVPREHAAREEVARLTGQRLVPVLIDGDLVVWDSARIAHHVAERYGGGASGPPPSVGGTRPLAP
jgi:glutathione S-transferase